MKLHLPIILFASAAVLSAQPKGFQTPAIVSEKDKPRISQIWIIAATKTQIRYRERETSMDTKDARVSSFGGLYLLEPPAFTEAMDLYDDRKYKEAQEAFAKIKETYKPVSQLPNNPGTQAAFYEMECLRQLEEYEELSKRLTIFMKDPLSREGQLRQLELYVLWDALRTEAWKRLDILCRERDKSKLPADQRAQVEYLHGRALEGLKKNEEALVAYNAAMVADAAASETLARDSAIRIMRMHKADPLVQQAIKVWGAEDENKGSPGYFHLQEAGAVAALYELGIGAGEPLPSDLKMLLRYKPDAAGP